MPPYFHIPELQERLNDCSDTRVHTTARHSPKLPVSYSFPLNSTLSLLSHTLWDKTLGGLPMMGCKEIFWNIFLLSSLLNMQDKLKPPPTRNTAPATECSEAGPSALPQVAGDAGRPPHYFPLPSVSPNLPQILMWFYYPRFIIAH